MATRPINPLITDRKASDITNKTHKGNYNASDLNRVEEWCRYLADILNEYGYYINIETKTDWQISFGHNMTSNIRRIKNNIIQIKEGFFYLSDIEIDPTKLSINYQDANDLEKLMNDIDKSIGNMEKAFRYADFLIAGEDLGMPDILVN